MLGVELNQHSPVVRQATAFSFGSVRSMVARLGPGGWCLALGVAALMVPTLIAIARFSWSTEQGGHGPLVLATGLWLIAREWSSAAHLRASGRTAVVVPLMAIFLCVYVLAHITGILEIEGFAAYGAVLTTIYALMGGRWMRWMWFPFLYLAFVFPPPDTWVAAITRPIKIIISETVVDLLHAVGYPIASSGVTIQIAQYDLLVAAACAGLNSIISLSAICLLYIYLRHNANYRYFGLMLLAVLPVAIFANFVRVMLLILVTYHFGDAAAQGFIHDFAGLVMFAVALITIFAIDWAAAPLRTRLARRGHA